jgi:hypothetical protein
MGKPKLTKRDVQLLNDEGWDIVTEQPLFIKEKFTGSIATGIAGAIVIMFLQSERSKKTHVKKKANIQN